MIRQPVPAARRAASLDPRRICRDAGDAALGKPVAYPRREPGRMSRLQHDFGIDPRAQRAEETAGDASLQWRF
jgi:hypothetical protein